MLGITAAIPYGFSACPDQVAAPARAATAHAPTLARDVIMAVVAAVFSVLFISVLPQHRRGGHVEGLAAVHLLRPSVPAPAFRRIWPSVRGWRRSATGAA